MIDLKFWHKTSPPVNPIPLIPSLFALLLISTGCGGIIKTSPNELRENLRERANEATEVNYKKPLGRKTSLAESELRVESPSQEQSAKPHSLKPPSPTLYPETEYLTAKGDGESRRGAELDAASRLSAKIKSEVRSVVSSHIRSDNTHSHHQDHSSDEIRVEVSTHFAHAELIEFTQLPSSKEGQFQVIAALKRERYKKRVEPDLSSRVERLRSIIHRAHQLKTLHERVGLWPEVKSSLQVIRPQMLEYQMILRKPYTDYRALIVATDELKTKLEASLASLLLILDQPRLSNEALDELSPHLIRVVKEYFRAKNIQLRSPGQCLPDRYRIKLVPTLSSKTHPLTGGELSSLVWQVGLFTCPKEGEQERELVVADLPSISGVERYQSSANQQLIKKLKQISKSLKSQTRSSAKDQLTRKVRESLQVLLHRLALPR